MRKSDLLVGAGLIWSLYLTYGIVLRIPFAFHNDLAALTYQHGTGLLSWPEGKQLIPIGRLLNCIMANKHFEFINSISDFTLFRGISLGVVTLVALVAWKWLSGRISDSLVAAAIAAAILMLPSVQLFIVWNTQLIPGIIPMLLLLLPAWLMHSSPEKQSLALQGGISIRVVASAVVSCVVVTIVNFIYPPIAAMFLVPTLACVLFMPRDSWESTRLLVVRDLFVYSVSCIFFFLVQKYVVGPYSEGLLPSGFHHGDPSFRLEVSSDVFGNALQVFGKGGSIALHLWDITLSRWSSAVSVVALLVGVSSLFADWRVSPASAASQRGRWLQYALSLGALAILSNAPNVLSPKPLIALRTIFAMSAMIALVAIKGILFVAEIAKNKEDTFIKRLLFIAMLIAISTSAQNTVSAAAINSFAELEAAKFSLLPYYMDKQLNKVIGRRGVSEEVFHSGRPILDIVPNSNLLGAYLPMEFGLWYNGEYVLRWLAREWSGNSVDKPFDMAEFVKQARTGHDTWCRDNPWPVYWSLGP